MNEQQQIWEYLKANSVGRNNAIHIADLANNLGFPPNGTNNDDVRRWIKDMVMDLNLPIGTCRDGVFLFTNEEEREEAVRFIERRTKADVIRTINYYTPE
jgi:hypothetical protein